MTQSPIKSRTAVFELVIPLVILVIGTIICLLTDLDLNLSRLFYDSQLQRWSGNDSSAIVWSYQWGPALTAIAGLGALFYVLASYFHPRFWAKRAVSLFILLCIVFGPIILVNGVLKESWRRPRPRDITEFNGSHTFRKVLEVGNREYRGKSFPSGHASAGFILVLFFFLLKKRHTRAALLALLFSLGWGTWLSYVRISLGGHFFSDTLYAFGLNWLVSWLLYYQWYLPYSEKKKNEVPFQPSRRRYIIGGLLLATVSALLIFRFLVTTPFRIDYPAEKHLLPSTIEKLTVKVRVKKGDILIRHGAPGSFAVQTWINGHAPSDVQAKRDLTIRRNPRHWQIEYRVEPDGYFHEYQSHSYIYTPKGLHIEWDLFTKQGAIIREDLPSEP